MDQLKQIKLLVGFVTGTLFATFWDTCALPSFILSVSVRQDELRFIFSITLNNVLYKAYCSYPLKRILNNEISKEKIAQDMYKKIIENIPTIKDRVIPVVDPTYDPKAPSDDICLDVENIDPLSIVKRNLVQSGRIKT